MYDLIIIGSGPAGLSAAVYGKRAGLDLVVLEKNPMSGGQVLNTYEVDNYLGMPGMNGFDMGVKFREHADKLGAEFREASVLSIETGEEGKIVRTDGEELQAKAVILAAGAVHARLEVPGEEALGGRGVSYCATCDGAFFRGRTVAVVGGGDVALEDAIYLSRLCEKVYLIHRRARRSFSRNFKGSPMWRFSTAMWWKKFWAEIRWRRSGSEIKRRMRFSSSLWQGCLWQWESGPARNWSGIWISATREAMSWQGRTAPPVFRDFLRRGMCGKNRSARLRRLWLTGPTLPWRQGITAGTFPGRAEDQACLFLQVSVRH